jgi:hypothetical protein
MKFDLVEKGGTMKYETPAIKVVGEGSELVQAFVGPHTDLGAHALSLGASNSRFDEE